MRGPVSVTGLKVPRAATADPRRAGVLNAEYAHRTTARPPALLSVGHWQAGTVALYRGDLQEAQHHLEHALATSRDIAPGVPGDALVDLTLVCQGGSPGRPPAPPTAR